MATAGAGLAKARTQLGVTRKRLGRGALKPKVTVHGLTEAKKELNAAARKVKDLRPVLKNAAVAIDTAMRETFRNQADPAGVAWERLADSTMRAKIGKGKGVPRAGRYKTLRKGEYRIRYEKTAAQRALETRKMRYATGGKLQRFMPMKRRYLEAYHKGMMGGVRTLVDGGRMINETHAVVVGKRTIEFGNKIHYSIYHQTGTRKMPARKWAPVQIVGGKWKTIKTGPAGTLWDSLADRIGRFVLHGNGEPPVKA